MTVHTETFRKQLRTILKEAERLDLVAVEINAGNLHRRVGGYPGTSHRMPLCCEVMYSEMKPGDVIVKQPESGKGASVVVRYRLPR